MFFQRQEVSKTPPEVNICLSTLNCASAGMCNEQLNMLHVQIGTLTLPSSFRERAL